MAHGNMEIKQIYHKWVVEIDWKRILTPKTRQIYPYPLLRFLIHLFSLDLRFCMCIMYFLLKLCFLFLFFYHFSLCLLS